MNLYEKSDELLKRFVEEKMSTTNVELVNSSLEQSEWGLGLQISYYDDNIFYNNSFCLIEFITFVHSQK